MTSNAGRAAAALDAAHGAALVTPSAAASLTERENAPVPAAAAPGADLRATPASAPSHDSPWRQERSVSAPATALPEAGSPPPPFMPAATARRVQETLLAAVRAGRREVSLELEPAHLGRLRIRLQVEQSKVGVELVAENGAARAALEAHLAELSRGLSDQGLELGRFSVSLDDGTRQQAADRQAPETTPAGAFKPAGDAVAAEGVSAAAVDRVALGMNRVDRVA